MAIHQFRHASYEFTLQSDTPTPLIVPNSSISLRACDTQEFNARMPTSGLFSCLDVYLDNIMANVPQLALALEKQGFVQAIKVMQVRVAFRLRFLKAL